MRRRVLTHWHAYRTVNPIVHRRVAVAAKCSYQPYACGAQDSAALFTIRSRERYPKVSLRLRTLASWLRLQTANMQGNEASSRKPLESFYR
jgi:hypothetical protein